jgi:hypothetical protein
MVDMRMSVGAIVGVSQRSDSAFGSELAAR